MNSEPELVTVFRSAEPGAEEDAENVRSLLEEGGLSPVVWGDSKPGVPLGACEVRVPVTESTRADQLIAAAMDVTPEVGDPSHDLDLETVFSAIGVSAEVESLGIRSVLDANNIPNLFVSPPQYPNLRFVVKVPRRFVAQAKQVLADAEAAGPAAADEAEEAGEK